MNDQPKPEGKEERPQVFSVDRETKQWKFTRRGLMAAAVGLAASAALRSRMLAGPVRALDAEVHDKETGDAAQQVEPGQHIYYSWRVQNVGAAPWGLDTSLRLVHAGKWQMPDSIPLPDAAPGEVVTITVEAVVPDDASVATSEWELVGSLDTTYKLYLPLIFSNATGVTPCPTHIVACPSNVVVCPTFVVTCPVFKAPTPTATPCPSHIVACPTDHLICPAFVVTCPVLAAPTPTATTCGMHFTCPAFNTCPAHIVGCPVDFGCPIDVLPCILH